MARGHHISSVPELPLVVNNFSTGDGPEGSTAKLLATLKKFGVGDELVKVNKSKKIRTGKGKYRNSRYVMRKGPLIVYSEKSKNVKQAARNIPGVDVCNVHRLNILQLAPGGHLGRFLIFTKDAFTALNKIFGTHRYAGVEKSGYHLNRSVMTCADLSRIINSDKVQASLREQRVSVRVHDKTKKNPITNKAIMQKLNPFAKEKAALLKKADADRAAKKKAALKAKRSKAGRASKATRTKTFAGLQQDLKDAYKAAEDIIEAEELAGNYVPGDTEEEDE